MGIMVRGEGKLVRTFEPIPPPAPHRQMPWLPIHQQEASIFLTRLPSEIRNEIYALVFGTSHEMKKMEDSGESGEDDEGDIGNARIADEEVMEGGEWTSKPGEQRKSVSTQEGSGQPLSPQTSSRASTTIEDSRTSTQPRSPSLQSLLEQSKPAHPLSLLVTCRKICAEATVLAFSVHTFRLPSCSLDSLTYFSLKRSTSCLFPVQFSAITNLSLDLCTDYAGTHHQASEFMSNAILLFPSVRNLEVRVKRGRLTNVIAHSQGLADAYFGIGELSVKEAALRRFVPGWWYATVRHVVSGRSFSWQKGEKWEVSWPQFDDKAYREDMEWMGESEGWKAMGEIPKEAVANGGIEGVEMCVCGCEQVVWLKAYLLQETGRKVNVSVQYFGDNAVEELQNMKVRLEPLEEGEEPLPVEVVDEGRGFVWEVDQKYWNEMRARKGGLVTKVMTWRPW